MKNKIIYIFLSAVFLFLLSCDGAVLEPQERLNPNDNNSIVPAPNSLSINLDGDIGNRYVNIGWDVSENTENIDGWVIMRKAGSAPQNIYDGDIAAKILFGGGQEWTDNDVDSNSEYPQGYEVYYSVFTYTGKYDDTGSLEIDPDTNEFYNPHNYYFVGPVSDSVSVLGYIDLPVSDDRYISEFNNVWVDNNTINIVTDNNTNRTLAGIMFDLSSFPDGVSIAGADLILVKNDVSNDNTNVIMQISRWEEDWLSTNDFSALDGMTIFNLENVQVPYENGAKVTVDVLDTFSGWIDGSYSNFGFKLRSTDSPAVQVIMPFCASEEGDCGPKLRAYYWY